MDHVLWISGRGDTLVSHVRIALRFEALSNIPIF